MITKRDAELLKAYFSTKVRMDEHHEVMLSEVTSDTMSCFSLEAIHRGIDSFLEEQNG